MSLYDFGGYPRITAEDERNTLAELNRDARDSEESDLPEDRDEREDFRADFDPEYTPEPDYDDEPWGFDFDPADW